MVFLLNLLICGFGRLSLILVPRSCNVLVQFCPFVMFLVNHGKFPKQEDSYAFEEDSSSESLSPEQPLSDESQSSAGLLAESKASSGIPSPSLTTGSTQVRKCITYNNTHYLIHTEKLLGC